jgi:predicted dehydrogenase
MAIEKIRVGIIGASMRNGWGRDAHIPALRALPDFEVTAVSTSRRKPQTKRPSISEFPTLLPTLTKSSSTPTWTLSRFACGCLFTINWGLLL